MSIDLNKIKRRLQGLQRNSNDTWKADGDHVVRIVQTEESPNYPFFELYFHYDIGGKTYLSPISFGEKDPFVETAKKLEDTGDDESKVLAKKLRPKMRIYSPIVVRGEEKEGVKYWGYSRTTYQEILSIIDDPDWGDITDPESGRDLGVKFMSKDETGKNFDTIKVTPKPKQRPVVDEKDPDYDKIINLIENPKPIKEVFATQLLTYDELKKVLENWLNVNDEEEKDEEKSAPESSDEEKDNVSPSDLKSKIDSIFSKDKQQEKPKPTKTGKK